MVEYRERQISKLPNVEFIPNMTLDAAGVCDFGADIVVIATGSRWSGDGITSVLHAPIEGVDAGLAYIATPEQLVLEGKHLGDRVAVVDSDGYHMGCTVADYLAQQGKQVTYVTHFDNLGPYLRFTLEEQRMYQPLTELGVEINSQQIATVFEPGRLDLVHVWGGQTTTRDCDSLVIVSHRQSTCELYNELLDAPQRRTDAGVSQLHLIGDAHTPGMIAQAVFSAHRLAREIDSDNPDVPLLSIRERRLVGATEDDYALSATTLLASGSLNEPTLH